MELVKKNEINKCNKIAKKDIIGILTFPSNYSGETYNLGEPKHKKKAKKSTKKTKNNRRTSIIELEYKLPQAKLNPRKTE